MTEQEPVQPPPEYKFTPQQLGELVLEKKPDLLEDKGGVAGLMALFNTSPLNGLSTSGTDVEKLSNYYGINKVAPRPPKSFGELLLDTLKDLTLIILLVSAVISIAVSFIPTEEEEELDWIEGVAILSAVVIVCFVTAVNDFQKEKQFRKLNAVKENKLIKVIRDGDQTSISIYDIVVGDIVVLATGDSIPADGILYDGTVRCDESSMTGETDEIDKDASRPFLIGSCTVTAGSGRMLITAVGKYSMHGDILSTLQEETSQTPLQEKLDVMAALIGKIGTGAAAVTFLALVIKWAIALPQGGFEWHLLTEWVDFLVLAITIIVVAVPEGLPLAVTISLAYSMKKMLRDKILVRKLEACETFGTVSVICSDKTGTLTENRMTVVEMVTADNVYSREDNTMPTAPAFNEDGVATSDGGLADPLADLIALNATINSTATLDLNEETQETRVIGSKTEGALLMLARNAGYKYKDIRRHLVVGDHAEGAKAVNFEFSSDRKRMTTIVDRSLTTYSQLCRSQEGGTTDEPEFRLLCKGASEIVLGCCTTEMHDDGTVGHLSENRRSEIEEHIMRMASGTLRTLVLAYRDVPVEYAEETVTLPDGSVVPMLQDPASVEADLTFLCLVGIKDPLRASVPGAVAACKGAGISVRMITGDNIITATAIAKECGILSPDVADADLPSMCIEGPVFRKLTDEQVDALLPTLRVMARSAPKDKHRLVKRLRHHQYVVAASGDGSNDAPALKEADVGVAMGIAGTEVAKEASDIVIMDDNFASIVRAVEWGRTVTANIRKFLQFQLTVNVVALLTTFLGSVFTGDSPLNAVQLLYVNLIMDSLGSLALATEEPAEDVLAARPIPRNASLLTPCMIRNIAVQSVYQLTLLLVLMSNVGYKLVGMDAKPTDSHLLEEWTIELNTCIYNAFIFCQIFNEFNARRIKNELNCFKGVFQTPLFVLVIIASTIMQVLIVAFGGKVTETAMISGQQWIITILMGFISLPLGLVARAFKAPTEFAEKDKEVAPRVTIDSPRACESSDEGIKEVV